MSESRRWERETSVEGEAKKALTLFSCSVVVVFTLCLGGPREPLQPRCGSLPTREDESETRRFTSAAAGRRHGWESALRDVTEGGGREAGLQTEG